MRSRPTLLYLPALFRLRLRLVLPVAVTWPLACLRLRSAQPCRPRSALPGKVPLFFFDVYILSPPGGARAIFDILQANLQAHAGFPGQTRWCAFAWAEAFGAAWLLLLFCATARERTMAPSGRRCRRGVKNLHALNSFVASTRCSVGFFLALQTPPQRLQLLQLNNRTVVQIGTQT